MNIGSLIRLIELINSSIEFKAAAICALIRAARSFMNFNKVLLHRHKEESFYYRTEVRSM